MIPARAVAIAALTVFGWVFLALAGLMAIYVGLAVWAGDPSFKIAYLGLFLLLALGAAFGCRHMARRIGR
ncbi:hypothetical protein [Phreatobacter oligotrophus]|uniref:Uncharacterized protein n=1 Tax=Phreatobacter oligotrophus TaxID=1122261 RepID=A0A2T4YZI6_9HYPH|nr:hypothetical protein [Phreatobacter oligotrophus]PTM52387.1 hypothetical protein C8P69_108188 [Phreatobacter oligotrophus]